MNIIHNIAFNAGSREKADFSKAGVELESGFTGFKIDESDPRYGNVASLVVKYKAVDTITTKFSASELNCAKSLAVVPSWHHGYPEPADDRGFLNTTFDLADYCKSCGVGKRQVSPFRLNKSPSWGKRSILQLNWIFDEYFVKPDVWAAIFEPCGIKCIPVLLDKTGTGLDSIVQLDITSIVDLQLDGANYEICPSCGRKKYLPFSSGFYPAPSQTDLMLFKSSQYFGSGANAHRMVLVSGLLYRRITEADLKGVEFKACRP